MLASTGYVYNNGNQVRYVASSAFYEEATIEVIVNWEQGDLYFAINGEHYGKAFTDNQIIKNDLISFVAETKYNDCIQILDTRSYSAEEFLKISSKAIETSQ